MQETKLIHCTCRIIIKVTSKNKFFGPDTIHTCPVVYIFFLHWGSFTSWTISVEAETETPAPCFVCLLPILSSFLHSGDYPKSPYSCVQKFEHLGEGPLTEFVLLQKLYFGLHCRCGSRKDGHFKEKKLQKNYFFNNKDACHQSIFFFTQTSDTTRPSTSYDSDEIPIGANASSFQTEFIKLARLLYTTYKLWVIYQIFF